MCFYFDGIKYTKLQMAYNLLDKSQISMIDNLHVHYITAIYNTAFNTVNSFVNETDIVDYNENSGKNPYKTLCLVKRPFTCPNTSVTTCFQSLNHEVFIPCLVQLCKSLFKIVVSYNQLVKWHERQDCEDIVSSDMEDNMNKQYIKQKLEHNVTKIWDDVQRKVSSLLLNSDLASYKFDQFVQVLSIVHK